MSTVGEQTPVEVVPKQIEMVITPTLLPYSSTNRSYRNEQKQQKAGRHREPKTTPKSIKFLQILFSSASFTLSGKWVPRSSSRAPSLPYLTAPAVEMGGPTSVAGLRPPSNPPSTIHNFLPVSVPSGSLSRPPALPLIQRARPPTMITMTMGLSGWGWWGRTPPRSNWASRR